MNVARILKVSIEGWHLRLRRLTRASNRAQDESAWWRTLDDSMIGRGASGLVAACRRAYPGSRLAQALRAAAAFTPVEQMRFIGVATSVAAIVHMLLMWPRGMVGFWWLILPAIALAFGLLATTMAAGASRR